MLAPILRTLLETKLQRELASITESQSQAQSGMTHAESRAENDKDTRAIESSYLARGLANRVGELKKALSTIQSWKIRAAPSSDEARISLGRIATLVHEDEDTVQQVWLAPDGGGQVLTHEGRQYQVLTPQAPLGRALLGREVDDEIEVQSPSGVRRWVIEHVTT